MFSWFEFCIGLVAGGACSVLLFMVGGLDAAVAAVGVPIAAGVVGVFWNVLLRRRTRPVAPTEVAA